MQRTQPDRELQRQKFYWQRGLCMGPSLDTRGAICVAVREMVKGQGKIQFITTGIFKNVSDGGNLNPYMPVDKIIGSIIDHTIVDAETIPDHTGIQPSIHATVQPTPPTQNLLEPGFEQTDTLLTQPLVSDPDPLILPPPATSPVIVTNDVAVTWTYDYGFLVKICKEGDFY